MKTFSCVIVCDYRGTLYVTNEECVCKRNTTGAVCNKCKSGTGNLTYENPDGCEGDWGKYSSTKLIIVP